MGMFGKHERKTQENPPPHVHKWQSQGYDASMRKVLWRCAVKCEDAGRRNAEVWLEPGKHPND